MKQNKSVGIKIFAVIYMLIGLVWLYIALLPIIWKITGNPRLEWIIGDAYTGSYLTSGEVYLNILLSLLIAVVFITSGISLLHLNAWGHKLSLFFTIIICVLGVYVLIPLIVAHIIFFMNPKVRKNLR